MSTTSGGELGVFREAIRFSIIWRNSWAGPGLSKVGGRKLNRNGKDAENNFTQKINTVLFISTN